MNTYFLGLLKEDKKRKRNRALICKRYLPWDGQMEVGDTVILGNSKDILIEKGKNIIWRSTSGYAPLLVSDYNFSPYYWEETNFWFCFNQIIINRIISSLKSEVNGFVRVKIGKSRYKFYVDDQSRPSLIERLSRKNACNFPMFRYEFLRLETGRIMDLPSITLFSCYFINIGFDYPINAD
jgi:hypothetical protein